ncbi:DUF6213 family protein [Streptomyces vietnamensis]|uniref:Uncharacterized protein n=1 Tax=Streptomyces vietnamensis TaxID=362257 RepID=A0A0B5I2L1_9ACTN|nr:DUF6213 family protein [Streptomyces vietnamensis]AJF68380.1 hypothetical protein SVTN_32585 [Streptomyces vietnamensis]
MNASMSLVHVPGGPLLLPADEVTLLLRQLASRWLESADDYDSGLEPETVEALVCSLTEVADRIDAECIALLPLSGGGEDGFDGR